MFGSFKKKKNRHSAQPLTSATANPNAQTAAAAVFGRRNSDASLSSAAAAAALRARPTTPINVGDVQTKRTQKRSTSVSSHGSQPDPRRNLQRSHSQSSMTERTFRSPSPSPHRPATSAGHETASPQHPPVPAIPDGFRANETDAKTATAPKKSNSLHTQPFRVASQKQKDGGGSWFGGATEGNMSNVRQSDVMLRTTKPSEPRPGAVSPSSSVNFSYPRGTRVASPPPQHSPSVEGASSMTQNQASPAHNRNASTASRQSTSSDQSLVYDANSRRMVPKADLLARERSVKDASEKPVKRRKSQTGGSRSGSHLAKGSVARVRGTAVEGDAPSKPSTVSPQTEVQSSLQSQPQPQPRPQTLTQVQPQQEAQTRISDSPEPKTLHHPAAQPQLQQQQRSAAISVADPAPAVASPSPAPEPEPAEQSAAEPVTQDIRLSDGATILPHAVPKESAAILGRRPSTVGEESSDDEDVAEETPAETETTPSEASDGVMITSSIPSMSQQSPQPQSRPQAPPQPRVEPQPEHQTSTAPVSASFEEPSAEVLGESPGPSAALHNHGSMRSAREHSSSPVRNARFAVGHDRLMVKHEPPPRSLSPIKSALKHSRSPSRGASPSEDGSDISTAPTHDETTLTRKKSNRVSFDDQSNMVIGEAAEDQQGDSAIFPSPQQARKPWYSNIGRSKKREAVNLDDDEVMKPRPALPMFGSVREKKPRETEERPLVTPAESTESPANGAPVASPSSLPADEVQDPIGQSTDQNIASILLQDSTTRHEPNTSRYREPLPPVVTSLEGSGYYSPSSSSEDEANMATEDESVQEPLEAAKEPALVLGPEHDREDSTTGNSHLTGIAALQQETAPTSDERAADFDGDIPTISIIEPSPGAKVEETEVTGGHGGTAAQSGYFDVPGGFPEDDSHEHGSVEPTAGHHAPSTASPGIISSTPDAVPTTLQKDDYDASPNTPVARAPQVSTIREESESSSGDSIYSDAYEDLSEAEGDGFQSLDAVLTTPVSEKVSRRLFGKALAGSSQDAPREKQLPTPEVMASYSQNAQPVEDGNDWENAKAYWRGLTNEKRKQLEREALEEAGVEADQEETTPPKKSKKKRSSRTVPLAESTEQQQAVVDPDRVYQIKPGSKADHDTEHTWQQSSTAPRNAQSQQQVQQNGNGRLRKSMRGSQAVSVAVGDSGMRKSLRSDAGGRATGAGSQLKSDSAAATSGGSMRKSMRQNGSTQPSGGPQPRTKPTRPVSLPQAPAPREVPQAGHKKQASLDSPAAGAARASAQSTLRRRGSDSSETSFRRARPQRQGLGFRKSMRSPSPERPSTAGGRKSSRFSIRSLSPPAAPASPPPTMGNRGGMKSTLRSESSERSTTRVRIPGFGRSSKKDANKDRRSQRLADSSDEDNAGASTAFRSRFADSSDEDEPTPQAASRGFANKSMRGSRASPASSSAAAAAMGAPAPAPRQAQRIEDSPELSDSSDEEQLPPQRTPSGRVVKPSAEIQGLQRKRSGRGELMPSPSSQALNAQGQAQQGQTQTRRSGFFGVLRRKKDKDAGKISRPAPSESAARSGTKLERTPEELAAMRRSTSNSSAKLQKPRIGSWPLPGEAADGAASAVEEGPQQSSLPRQQREAKRPSTSGGELVGDSSKTALSRNAGLMNRRSTSYHDPVAGAGHTAARQPDEESAVDGSQIDGSVRKKKFAKLRKMFGLHD